MTTILSKTQKKSFLRLMPPLSFLVADPLGTQTLFDDLFVLMFLIIRAKASGEALRIDDRSVI
jgi:hypothetical protein